MSYVLLFPLLEETEKYFIYLILIIKLFNAVCALSLSHV